MKLTLIFFVNLVFYNLEVTSHGYSRILIMFEAIFLISQKPFFNFTVTMSPKQLEMSPPHIFRPLVNHLASSVVQDERNLHKRRRLGQAQPRPTKERRGSAERLEFRPAPTLEVPLPPPAPRPTSPAAPAPEPALHKLARSSSPAQPAPGSPQLVTAEMSPSPPRNGAEDSTKLTGGSGGELPPSAESTATPAGPANPNEPANPTEESANPAESKNSANWASKTSSSAAQSTEPAAQAEPTQSPSAKRPSAESANSPGQSANTSAQAAERQSSAERVNTATESKSTNNTELKTAKEELTNNNINSSAADSSSSAGPACTRISGLSTDTTL